MALTKIIGDGVGVLTTADEGSLKLQTGTTSASFLSFADGDNNRGYVKYDHNDDSLELGVAGESHFKIDSAHILTMDKQPAFLADLTALQENLPTGQFNTLNFDNEIYDQNADFNTSTKTFTAPVTGRYMLSANMNFLNVDIDASYYQIELKTSNRAYLHILSPKFTEDVPYYTANISICADMDASDTAYVRVYQSGGAAQTDINASSHFSGFLVA
jgi:hypothetical protein